MKKLVYSLVLLSFLLASCKSKKVLVISPAYPVLAADSLRSDTTGWVSGLFAPDHSQLKELQRTQKQKKKQQVKPASHKSSVLTGVAPGTLITHSNAGVPSAYKGIDRVVNYDFTHRDVPEAFDGFRIAFISDLHYKSLFKEKDLDGLVRLLMAQQADVLLMGGDYQEGCEYVPELFAALAKVKTPMGTYGVMGNNDYERCHEVRNYIHHPPCLPHREYSIVLCRLAVDSHRVIVCRLRLLLHHRPLSSLVQWLGRCLSDSLFRVCTGRRHLLCASTELDAGCHSSVTGLRISSRHLISCQQLS
jgi:predicted phosphodiesterase